MNGAPDFVLRQLRTQIKRVGATPRFEPGGYTIVEVMIVLVVTSALFVSAAIMIGGRQNGVEFSQAVQDIRSVMQQTINQVGAGYYANTNNFTCNGTTGSLQLQAAGSGGGQQGKNNGCIFMGRAMQFGLDGGGGQQKYVTYTIAGLKKNGGSILAANPQAIAPGTNVPASNYPDASTTDTLHNGLTVYSMQAVKGQTTTPIGAVAFMSSLGNYQGGKVVSGTQYISVMPVLNASSGSYFTQSPLTTDSLKTAQTIDDNLKNITPAQTSPATSVQICFQSGGTNQSARMTIGSDGGALQVNVAIKANKTCS